MMKIKIVLTIALLWAASSSLCRADYTPIYLNAPEKNQPIEIRISPEQSRAYHWQSGQAVEIKISCLRPDGTPSVLRDVQGRDSWTVRVDNQGRAEVFIKPEPSAYSGRLWVRGNGKILYSSTPSLSEIGGKTLEKIYEYSFWDGASVRVHYTDQILDETGADPQLPRAVFDSAVAAYQTITQFQGFNSRGYTFAHPDQAYAYDPDKTIDIYLGNPSQENLYSLHGFGALSFKDAPCFDTISRGKNQYDAVILLPANYKEFIRNWEKLNTSPLGQRHIDFDLRGTLTHEMLHTILFYYNKNLNRDQKTHKSKELDWYVEGLARYFETFAGARHDFYSQGFKQVLPDKIRFSRGGSNYFMRYPDQAFTGLRYENALFWRFMDTRYGMDRIEQLSRLMRDANSASFGHLLERVTGRSVRDLLEEYAKNILFKDFDLKEDAGYLASVAMTRLEYRDKAFYLLDGLDQARHLGATCDTDWVGSWGSFKSTHGSMAEAGDGTERADVSGWATDYLEIHFDPSETLRPRISIYHKEGLGTLDVQCILITRQGTQIQRNLRDIPSGMSGGIDLEKILQEQNLESPDLDRVYLLITNTHPRISSHYEVRV